MILGFVGIAAIVFIVLAGIDNRQRIARDRRDEEERRSFAIAAVTPQPLVIMEQPTAPPTPRKIKPSPATPPQPIIDIDAARAEQERQEYEERQRSRPPAPGNRNAIANAVNAANIAWQPPLINERGQRLRAICKNGEPSYYQGDRFWVCGTKSGVRIWFW